MSMRNRVRRLKKCADQSSPEVMNIMEPIPVYTVDEWEKLSRAHHTAIFDEVDHVTEKTP